MKKRVLITGGAGYIGSVLTKSFLERGHKVTCLDNLTFGSQSLMHIISKPNFEFFFGDVRNEETLKTLVPKYDIIIPLAGIVGMPQCQKNPIDTIMVNRDAIINIEKLRSPSQMMLFPNTNSGYGTTTGEVYCTEETPLNPISLYGQTKCEAEKKLLESDKQAISLRLATVFGISPRMRTDLLVNSFVFQAISNGYLVVFEKDFKRNFIHIQDVADCFEYCIDNYNARRGRAYNLGIDSANISKKELVEKIKDYIPKLDITYKEVGTDIDKRNYIVSNDRLRKSGFEAKRTVEEGIQELIKGYSLMFAKEVFRQ
jgi:nucleoside-diphosphate-sugar epimerase